MKSVLILDHKPLPIFFWAWRWIKRIVKEGFLQGQWIYIFRLAKKGGSTEIPSNLLKSLKTAGLVFSHNRYQEREYDTVCVIKNIDSLRWALRLKQNGKIKRLIVGPFISTLPTDNHSILESPLIDDLIFLCEWHRTLYLKLAKVPPSRSFIWTAGVDTEYWAPEYNSESNSILIYKKFPNPQLISEIEKELMKKNIPFETIQCGFYDHEAFRAKLRRSKLAVFVAQVETQGLAIFEAWSCGVATLHWDREFFDYYGRIFPQSSSSPYLSEHLGEKFKSIDEFAIRLDTLTLRLPLMETRKEMLKRHTLMHSARQYLRILDIRPREGR